MAPVDWPLLDPEPFGDGFVHDSDGIAVSTKHGGRTDVSIAIDDTPSILKYKDWESMSSPPGMRMQFCFQSRGGTLVLHTSFLEKPDPCGVRPIQFFPEVLCTHHQLVLLRLCTTDSNYPTYLFIYSFPYLGKEYATIHNLVPEISSSQSLGLLRDEFDCEKYVVTNLHLSLNQKIGSMEVFLDRWWHISSSRSFKLGEPVMVTLPSGIDIGKWRTDKVVPFRNTLLWIDYRQGILRCSNPLHKDNAKFDFFYLPNFSRISNQRPETFVSVGCCNGKLKFVKLHIRDVNTVAVYIVEWSHKRWQHCKQIYLKCTELWDAMKIALEDSPALWLPSDWDVSENHMPCFPVLRTDNDNIIVLTMSRKDNKHAWLLQVDMESGVLVGAADYAGFCNHQKPPCCTNCF